MSIKKLFNSSVQPTDQKYLLVRDDPRFIDKKNFMEEGWIKLCEYLDPGFEKKIAQKFHVHFWELYLGITLQNLNLELIPKEKQAKKRREGPDFCVKLNGKNLWIEATIADVGTKADKVPETVFDKVSVVPEEQILLRLANSISTKNNKRQEFLSKGIVNQNDLFVIGINGFRVTKLSDTEIPYIVKSVLGFGNDSWTYNLKTQEIMNDGYEHRKNIIKKSKEAVSTSPFANGELPGISGVVYSNVEIWNLPASLGSDFKFVHNPTADSRIHLQQGWMSIGQEYWVEGDKLRVKQHHG